MKKILLPLSISLLATSLSGCGIFRNNSQTVEQSSNNRVMEPSICKVAPPLDTGSDRNRVIDIAADLSAFAKLPVTGSFKTDFTVKYNSLFQTISDDNAKCLMVSQLAACYVVAGEIEASKIVLNTVDNACANSQ